MPLSDTRFLSRRRALSAKLAAQRVDAMLVTHLTHVRYLSGFSGSNGALLLHKDLEAQIATDGRYLTQIAAEVPDIEALDARAVGPDLLATVTGPKRVGFEAAATPGKSRRRRRHPRAHQWRHRRHPTRQRTL